MTDTTDRKDRPAPHDHVVSRQQHIGEGADRLDYTVTTGRVVLGDEVVEDGDYAGRQPQAEIFHVAYRLESRGGEAVEPTDRPVVFAFNGGPGSSSVWLHLGLLGPRRVVMGDAGALARPPYGLADNLETLLRVADLVFIDPVTTGFSRTVDGHKADDFHGFRRDLESVAEFIRLWTSRHGRWLSPKFLAGESYGTTRAAALAAHLAESSGLYLNGLMLISTALDFGTLDFAEGNDLPYTLFVPTYTAAAHYHGKVDGALADRVRESEEFAAGPLAAALARGHRLDPEERAAVVRRYAELTGLDAGYVDRADLRVDLFQFTTELLRDRGQVVGRLDLRFTGWPESAIASTTYDDPSLHAITGPYSAAFNAYVRGELGYRTDLVYNVLTPKVHPWSYAEFENAMVQVSGPLATAMRVNPALRVHVACGYYDGATPHFAAEHVFAHLKLPRDELDRVEWHYYEAGHMMYVHEPSRVAQSAALAAFVESASARD